MRDWFMWIVAGASLTGTVANVYKKRWSFGVWFFCNAAWCIYDLWLGAYPQAALMAVYFCLSIVGLYKWRTASAPAAPPEQEYRSHPYVANR